MQGRPAYWAGPAGAPRPDPLPTPARTCLPASLPARCSAGQPPPPLPLLMDCHVLVNHEYRTIFLRHAKTASSSLLCHFGGRCTPGGGAAPANLTLVPLEVSPRDVAPDAATAGRGQGEPRAPAMAVLRPRRMPHPHPLPHGAPPGRTWRARRWRRCGATTLSSPLCAAPTSAPSAATA